jgi:hypothetical protein
MMNEMSTPTVYLEVQVLKCAQILKKKGRYVPDISMAGGFINETQIFKSIAMSNFGSGPFVKAITMARAPLTAVMKSSYFIELAKSGKLPKDFADEYTSDPEKFFACLPEVRRKAGKDVPYPAVGLYTYLTDRIGTGLKQLMAGCRKWKLELLSRDDLLSLTTRAEEVTGIPTPDHAAEKIMENILG